MLIDERMKCENHQTNYQTLKAEHKFVQDEFTQLQGELRRLLSDRQAQQENVQLLLAELRGEMMDKTRELEELRLQVMTPQRLELLRALVQQEMEEETEKYRSDYDKLRYDYTFVIFQLEHQREEHARILEERRIHFDAELSRLEKDREDLVAQYQGSDPLCDGKRVEALLREKAQLHQRLKGLEAEVGELRAQKENCGQQAENVQRIQIRQLSESQSTLKSMEAERQSLHLKLEWRESELHLSNKQIVLLTGRLHKAEREVQRKTEIADLQQKYQAVVVQLGTLSHSESDLMEKNQRLRETIERLREELRTTRSQAEKSQHEAERMLEDRQVEWWEEKRKLQQRESELQHKHSLGKEKMQRAAAAQKKRKTLTENKEKRLQDKIQLLQAQKEELETAAAKKHSSFSVEQAQLSKRLKELQRQHNEFRHLLLGSGVSFRGGPAVLTSLPNPFLLLGTEGPLADIPDRNQRDLSLLRRRLQDLESAQ